MKTYFNIIDGNIAKCVERDLSQYPDTPAGDQALLDAINRGVVVPIKNRPVDAAIVGVRRPDLDESRTDFRGMAMVKSAAPDLLNFPNRTIPRPTGFDVPFAVQTAQNTVKWERIPLFVLHAKKVITYPGGLYLNMDDNKLRGFTHTTESARWKDNEAYPTQFRRAMDGAFYSAARAAAEKLSPGNATRVELEQWYGNYPTYEGTHKLLTTDAAARLYAREWVDQLLTDPTLKGGGVDYFTVNHESGHDSESQSVYINHIGMIIRAMIDEFATRGFPNVKCIMYDFGDLCHSAPYFFDQAASSDGSGNAIPDPDPTIPQYMHPYCLGEPYRGNSRSTPLGDSTILGQLMKAGKISIGVVSYLQAPWDNETYWQKNSDSTLKLDSNGNPLWRTDERIAIVAGQSQKLYEGDARMGMIKYYSFMAKYHTNMFFRAGGVHLPMSNQRQAGWENMIGTTRSFRLDAEVESGTARPDAAELNQRALSPTQVKADAEKMYLFNDYLKGHMATQMPTNLGEKRTGGDALSQSRASVEQMALGFLIASKFNWIFDTPYRVLQPVFWIWKAGITGAIDPLHHLARKPIIFGGYATKDGKPAVWLYYEYPTQDVDKFTDVYFWYDNGLTGANAKVAPNSWRLRMQGREPGIEWFYLPETATGLAAKDFLAQFVPMVGGKLTWRMDYRVPRITNHPVPPAVIELPVDVTITPVPDPVDTLFIDRIQRRFDGTNLYYDIALSQPGLTCQLRSRQRSGVFTEWFAPQPYTDAAKLAQGYTHFWYGNFGAVGTSTLVEFRINAEDLNVIQLPYTIPSGIDTGSIVYSNDPANPAMWQFETN